MVCSTRNGAVQWFREAAGRVARGCRPGCTGVAGTGERDEEAVEVVQQRSLESGPPQVMQHAVLEARAELAQLWVQRSGRGQGSGVRVRVRVKVRVRVRVRVWIRVRVRGRG